MVDSDGRIIELEDDPLLEGGPPRDAEPRRSRDSRRLDESKKNSLHSQRRKLSRSSGSHHDERQETRDRDDYERRR